MREYYVDEYDLMDAIKSYLEQKNYIVEHVPRKKGRKYKNDRVGTLDLVCRKGTVYFEIETKNPNKKPHQWIIQGSQINRFYDLRAAKISHALLGGIKEAIKFIERVENGEYCYEYSGLKFI